MAATLVICGLFASYFLASGARALLTGRMTVVNPNSRSSSPGLLGALLWKLRAPPPPDAPTARHVEATAGEARARGLLHVALGLAFVAGGVATLVLQ